MRALDDRRIRRAAGGIAQLSELAPAVRRMAESGEGTDACLKLGCLPMLVHFYSPVPDIADLKGREVWAKRSALAGIDLQVEKQLALLERLGRDFGTECDWPRDDPGEGLRFFTNNPSFSFGCAAATHLLIREFKPRRIIEIGSGASSRVIAAAIRSNTIAGAPPADYTIIDPYPGPLIHKVPGITRVIPQRVELVDLGVFDQLGAGDILFIDSGHTVRIGGDVNFLILDVLPRLQPGVLTHVHDIPMPFEYAEVYFTNPRFRMFWTESYLLQAFLCFNSRFEILLAMNLIMSDYPDAFRSALPAYNPEVHRTSSHSFWIRRVS